MSRMVMDSVPPWMSMTAPPSGGVVDEGVVFDVDAVADGDADVVALDAVLLGEAVFDAPAEEDADVVAAQGVVANDGPLPLIPHF